MVHVSSAVPLGPLPTEIGKNVVVEAGTILHACKIEDGAVIGAGCTVLDGAVVGTRARLEPGSVLGVGKSVPSGQVWGGVPARQITQT